jgi:hypothetical protein
MVCKTFLQFGEKMNAATFVEIACSIAADLEDREIRYGRSRPDARQRVARIAGVPASLLHSLRYRRPKTIGADVFERLCSAVERQATQQIKELENEILAIEARRIGATIAAFARLRLRWRMRARSKRNDHEAAPKKKITVGRSPSHAP